MSTRSGHEATGNVSKIQLRTMPSPHIGRWGHTYSTGNFSQRVRFRVRFLQNLQPTPPTSLPRCPTTPRFYANAESRASSCGLDCCPGKGGRSPTYHHRALLRWLQRYVGAGGQAAKVPSIMSRSSRRPRPASIPPPTSTRCRCSRSHVASCRHGDRNHCCNHATRHPEAHGRLR